MMSRHSINAQRPTALLISAVSLATTLCATGVETLDSELRTNGAAMHEILAAASATLQQSSAVVYQEHKELAYATVARSDGYLLSKSSVIKDAKSLQIRIDRTLFEEVKIVATDPRWDLVLLKIAATGLQPPPFAPNSHLDIGSWVIANGATSRAARRPMIGIISAQSRPIPAESGVVLGVEIKPDPAGLRVGEEPATGTGAHRAGIMAGDIICSISGKPIKHPDQLDEILNQHQVGDSIDVAILRKSEKLQLKVELSDRAEVFGIEQTRNDEMSGDISVRRSGFPRVLQHDILGNSTSVGGPLLNLQGQCVGMNIARANRAESLAIPVEELREACARLLQSAEPIAPP